MRFNRAEINRRIGSLARSLGYEIRRKGQGFHEDAFDDQRTLLGGREVRVVLDLGANVGQTAHRYRALFPTATVHSFEPTEETFERLTRSCQADPRIQPHRLAVADATGSRTLFQNSNDTANSLLPTAAGAAEFLPASHMATVQETEVPATTLDDFCAARGIAHVDVLKMDIQGGELLALRGAAGLLAAGAIDLIYTEVNFAPFYEGQASFHDLDRLLGANGYILYALYNLSRGHNGVLSWCDATFIGPQIRATLRRD